MARPKKQTERETLDKALPLLWRQGFAATSMDDLVIATGANRAAIYQAFGDKQGLFLAALDHYAEVFVTAAVASLDNKTAALPEIRAYFEGLIQTAERLGLPGPGCFMANTMVERAAHDPDAAARVSAHLARLESLFAKALARAGRPQALAKFLVVSAQGLWAYARIATSAEPLRDYVDQLMAAVETAR